MLVRVFNPRYAAGLRNKALVSAMLYAGLRAAEALSLKVRDVTWSGDEAGKVHLKRLKKIYEASGKAGIRIHSPIVLNANVQIAKVKYAHTESTSQKQFHDVLMTVNCLM